jgi:hypothetical protein
MNKDTRKETRKRYARPELRTLTLEFGVYGDYGGCGDGGDHHGGGGGHHGRGGGGGRRGGGWWWW